MSECRTIKYLTDLERFNICQEAVEPRQVQGGRGGGDGEGLHGGCWRVTHAGSWACTLLLLLDDATGHQIERACPSELQ